MIHHSNGYIKDTIGLIHKEWRILIGVENPLLFTVNKNYLEIMTLRFFRRSETVNFGSDIINCILKAQPIVGCEPAVNVSTPLHLATELTSERKKKNPVGRQHWQDLNCKFYTECDGTSSKLGAESRRRSFKAGFCVFFGCFDSNYRKRTLLHANHRTSKVKTCEIPLWEALRCFRLTRPCFKIPCIKTICQSDMSYLETFYQDWAKTWELKNTHVRLSCLESIHSNV